MKPLPIVIAVLFVAFCLCLARAMERYDAERCAWDGDEE